VQTGAKQALVDYCCNHNYRDLYCKTINVSGLSVPDEWPYIDTIYYVTINGSTCDLSTDEGEQEAQSIDGELDGSGTVCYNCEEHVHEDDVIGTEDEYWCRECHGEVFSYCERCEEYYRTDDSIHIVDKDEYWCEGCANRYAVQCHKCGDTVEENIEGPDGECRCESCHEEAIACCDHCEEEVIVDDLSDELCEECTNNGVFRCTECETIAEDDTNTDGVCSDCAVDKMEVANEV